MDTYTHTVVDLFGNETFSDNWIIVTDTNNCDVPVTEDDLAPVIPSGSNPHDYVPVWYYGQCWWIRKELHFPL